MRQVHLPGFTAELSVGVVMHPYFTNGKQTVRNTGMVSPQWSPIFDSVCNQSTGRRTCFRMSCTPVCFTSSTVDRAPSGGSAVLRASTRRSTQTDKSVSGALVHELLASR